MIRAAGIIVVAVLFAPAALQAASETADPPQPSDQPSAVQEEGLNRQILQTLKDIRDSQLSVLQAQVEILSILRSAPKSSATTHGHGTETAPYHHSGATSAAATASTSVAKASRSAAR